MPGAPIDPAVLAILRCPASGARLVERNLDGRTVLASEDRRMIYEIRECRCCCRRSDRKRRS